MQTVKLVGLMNNFTVSGLKVLFYDFDANRMCMYCMHLVMSFSN